MVFCSEHKAKRERERTLGIDVGSLLRSSDDAHTILLQDGDSGSDRGDTADRDTMQSTRRGLHCISRHGDPPPLRDDEGVDPSTLCRTSYSTEVAHVGQPVEEDEEG